MRKGITTPTKTSTGSAHASVRDINGLWPVPSDSCLPSARCGPQAISEVGALLLASRHDAAVPRRLPAADPVRYQHRRHDADDRDHPEGRDLQRGWVALDPA